MQTDENYTEKRVDVWFDKKRNPPSWSVTLLSEGDRFIKSMLISCHKKYKCALSAGKLLAKKKGIELNILRKED